MLFVKNYLDLSLVKAGKSSCNDLNLPPAKVSKRYNHFDSSLAKLAKIVTSFFNQLNLPPAHVFFFGGREEKNQLDLLQAKFAKNAISESKIKNIAWNHIHDLSKQLVIKARNLKLWFSTRFSIQILLRNFLYQFSIMIWIQLQGNKKLFFINYIFKSGRPEKHTWSCLFCIRRCPRPGAVTHVNFCLTIMSKFLSHQTDPTIHI